MIKKLEWQIEILQNGVKLNRAPSIKDIMDKINEIIDVLNGEEKE